MDMKALRLKMKMPNGEEATIAYADIKEEHTEFMHLLTVSDVGKGVWTQLMVNHQLGIMDINDALDILKPKEGRK